MRRMKPFSRKAPGETALHLVVSAIFLVVALSYLYILFWAFMSGTKSHAEIVANPFALPDTWQLGHFLEVFERLEVNGKNFFEMLFNSVWFSVVGVFLQQFVSATLAYACSKYEFPGSKWIYTIVLVIITLPIYGNSGAMYKLYHNLGLVNNYLQVIGSTGACTIYFLYYMAFFENMSWTYAEAAMMDGANDFMIYFKVMLPQAKAMFGSMFLTQWIGSWNAYESALIYLSDLPTLPVGIYQFNISMIYHVRLDILFAACVLVTIPALILFIVFNKTITTNVSAGGIKG